MSAYTQAHTLRACSLVQRLAGFTQQTTKYTSLSQRKDKNLDHVIITERRNKKAAKYLIEKQPYQFASKEQYEQAIRQPIGPDWNTQLTHKKVRAHHLCSPMCLHACMPTFFFLTSKAMDRFDGSSHG
jgi:hypothetical protein